MRNKRTICVIKDTNIQYEVMGVNCPKLTVELRHVKTNRVLTFYFKGKKKLENHGYDATAGEYINSNVFKKIAITARQVLISCAKRYTWKHVYVNQIGISPIAKAAIAKIKQPSTPAPGCVVKYGHQMYLLWKINKSGKAQLICKDGIKATGTPSIKKVTVVYKTKVYTIKKCQYSLTKIGVFSLSTGKLIVDNSIIRAIICKAMCPDGLPDYCKENGPCDVYNCLDIETALR